MKMNTFRVLAACMALALAAQVSASSTPSAQHSVPPGPAGESPAEAVVLPTGTLDAVTGAFNWGKFACWTAVVTVAVGASLAGSPAVGGAASAGLAVVCLILY